MHLRTLIAPIAAFVLFSSAPAQDLPHLALDHGRASLIVEGKPFFLLGAQVDNSSGWPQRLEALWPTVERLRLNTLEVPVYWEQVEPTQGRFDFSLVDATLGQAREHHVHLVLLWFGTWKNGKSHYVPEWVKSDPATYPRMMTRAGEPIEVLSPNQPANLNADRTAFVAFMHHLRAADQAHTVIMIQVENESGSLGSVRDFSPAAQQAFNGPVPGELVRGLHLPRSGTWLQLFGPDADETFAAWYVARTINALAAAGKQELALPMYVNNWLKSPRAYPVSTVPGDDYPSGGPTINMMPVWKVAAPAIDLLAPDIYVPSSERYRAVMAEFHTANNPLLVPESLGFGPFSGASGYARNLFYAIGAGAIGFAPFGLDRLRLDPPPNTPPNTEILAQLNTFRLIGSFDRQLATLAFAGKLQTAVEEPGIAQRELHFDSAPGLRVLVSYPPAYSPPPSALSVSSDTTQLHAGRVLVATLGPNEFLLAGLDCRVEFLPPLHTATHIQLLRVEEGRYDGETWVPIRLWNGDETDYGINFGGQGSLLRIKIGTF